MLGDGCHFLRAKRGGLGFQSEGSTGFARVGVSGYRRELLLAWVLAPCLARRRGQRSTRSPVTGRQAEGAAKGGRQDGVERLEEIWVKLRKVWGGRRVGAIGSSVFF